MDSKSSRRHYIIEVQYIPGGGWYPVADHVYFALVEAETARDILQAKKPKNSYRVVERPGY